MLHTKKKLHKCLTLVIQKLEKAFESSDKSLSTDKIDITLFALFGFTSLYD